LAQLSGIEKPLKELKNFSKGQKREREASAFVHSEGVAILIDAHLLRERGLGQIDLCRFYRDQIELFEVKSNDFEAPLSPHQHKRLKNAGLFLSSLFGKPLILRYSLGQKHFGKTLLLN